MKNQLDILNRIEIKQNGNRHTYCRYLYALMGFIGFLLLHASSYAAVQFEEVTTTAGIHHSGQSYGVSWGDFNGDGWPDAWVNNHLTFPSLYLNNGNGAFTDIAASVWPGQPDDDTHGATWGDFDNDGDQDLYQTIGAQEGTGSLSKQLLVNEVGVFIDKAAPLGVDYPLGRMRTALWVDQNNDGKLDLVVSNELRPDGQAPSTIFRQTENGFVDIGQELGFQVRDNSLYTQISDLNGDNQMDLLVHGSNFGSVIGFPYQVYDLKKEPFTDMKTSLGLTKTTHVLDSAIADFNGDLKSDIFLCRLPDPRNAQSDVVRVGADVIHVRLVTKANEHGVSFQASGAIKFNFVGQLQSSLIYVGVSGWHPGATVTLLPTDSKNWGIANHAPGVNDAVYVGYESVTQTWTILSSSPLSKDRWVRIETPSPSTVSQITAIHFNPAAIPLEDRIFFGSGSGFVDASATALPKDESGAPKRTWCKSVIAGDFDNDMDVDLYMVSTRATANLPNMLYENLGDGRFVAAPDAAGASGSLFGRGESVAAADYDRDGFLDLYVTNGFYSGPFNLGAGPDQLFHNQGNSNHWMEIDLQGVLSNRDGVGARVFVTTPDGKIQLREQNGGVHRYAQNHQRIHFGLGGNTVIQRLVVYWPSGQTQELRDVPADQILHIQEAQSPTVAIGDVTIDNRANRVRFTVSLSEPATELITVNYTTADGTAAAGICYTAVSGQLTFSPGEQVKTIEVNLLQCAPAADINFVMRLHGYQNVGVTDGLGVATLTRFPIWFNDVTQASGLARYGQGMGASWGEFNGDDCPDLWTSNHYDRPSLYINQCDGSFVDKIKDTVNYPYKIPYKPHKIILPSDVEDSHGASWADFDNDGDQDLFEASALVQEKSSYNMLFINTSGKLVDYATNYDVDGCVIVNDSCLYMRAKTPLWLDWNLDGLLDLIITSSTNSSPYVGNTSPTKLFSRRGGRFEDVTLQVGLPNFSTNYALLGDMNDDHIADIFFSNSKIYSGINVPFKDLSYLLNGNIFGNHIIIADFDGDLKNDIFLVRGLQKADIYQAASNLVNMRFGKVQGIVEQGATFKANGKLTIEQGEPNWGISKWYVGSTGYSPGWSLGDDPELPRFTLSPEEPSNFGLKEHTPDQISRTYVGYDPKQKLWTIIKSSSLSNFDTVGLAITAEGPISEVTPIGIPTFTVNQTNIMLRKNAGKFVAVTEQAHLGDKVNCYSAVAGDFDNDMDIDLYVLCGRPAGNTEHLLYANKGMGVFELIALSGGALSSRQGFADSVTVVDYDTDGFLDFFIVNSEASGIFFLGPHQLFHNAGNGNHWLEINLEGVISNRDGIGATVLLTTPDGKTQLREQNGGMHRYSQNHQRIHFGLGANAKAAKLEIRWPNGTIQEIRDIPADQLIRVIEPSLPSPKGKPTYTVGGDARVFVWQETFDGPYHLRVNGGGQDTQYTVNLLSDQPLAEAKAAGDVSLWTQTTHDFSLNAHLNNTEAGADFRLQSGARGLLAVNKDGSANPRQLGVGSTAKPLSPAGWMLPAASLAARPDYVMGVDAGLFIGAGTAENSLEARWAGNGPRRKAAFDLLASHPFKKMQPFSLEQDDKQFQTANSLRVDGWVAAAHDGANFILEPESNIGIAYRQDELFAYRRVNAKSGGLGMPNAYWLPQAEPYGKPVYDTSKEKGLFVWKDKGGLWHVRGTGGGGATWKISGRFISNQPAIAVTPLFMEFGGGGDLLNSADPGRIDFRMQLVGNGWDGFDFNLPPEATLKLELDIPEQSDRVRIGAEKWPISAAPLELSGW